MSIKRVPALFFAFSLSFLICAAEETGEKVEGHGVALGLGPAARSEAIRDAQTAILLDRLEKLAPSRDFSLFAPILEDAQSFFRSHKLIRETKTEDSTQVEIEAELLEAALKERVALIVMSENFIPPRVVIIAQEILAPDETPDVTGHSIIEKKLHEELKRIEFELVSPEALRARVPIENLGGYLTGDTERAAILAREMLADVVILGSGNSTVQREPGSANLDRVQAEVSLRIVRAEDGLLLDAPTTEAVVHSVNPREGGVQAVEDACGKLVQDVRTAIALGALGTTPQSGLAVTIKNIGGEAQSAEVTEALKRCAHVDKADVVFQDASLLRINLAYEDLISAFADCVSTVRLSFGKLILESAVGRSLILRVEH